MCVMRMGLGVSWLRYEERTQAARSTSRLLSVAVRDGQRTSAVTSGGLTLLFKGILWLNTSKHGHY